MLDFIARPLGDILNFIYEYLAFRNYGLSIIFFTIFVRLLILPLTIKQYKSTAKVQELQPQIQEIQRKYRNDKEKMNMELMKLYQENNTNPASGCFPLLVQMPIIFSLWYVITKPLTYMFKIPVERIYGVIKDTSVIEKGLLQIFNVSRNMYPEINILRRFDPAQAGDLLDAGLIQKILDLKKSMNFLGIDLGAVPTWRPSELTNWHNIALLIVPILAVVTTYLSSRITMQLSAAGGKKDNNSPKAPGGMLLVAPLMTLYFSFIVPAGLGLYWITGNLIQIPQQIFINKHILKKREVAKK